MDTQTFTLIIWEEVPESTKLILVPDAALDADDRTVLAEAHGSYINQVSTTKKAAKALNKISDALSPKAEYLSEEDPPGSKWAQRFVGHVVTAEAPIVTAISHVYRCGFLL